MKDSLRQRLSLLNLSIVTLLPFVISIYSNCALAQQILIERGGPDEQKLMFDQFQKILDLRKSAAKNRMDCILAEINSVCKLSVDQRTKLTVASKGAMVSNVEQDLAALVKASKSFGFEFDPDNPPEVPEEEDGEELDNEFVQVRRGMQVFDFSTFSGEIDSQKTWISAVEKTLTPQQLEDWATWQKRRLEQNRKAAVEVFVAKIDLKLLLSPDQRSQMTRWIDQEFGTQLVKQLQVSTRRNNYIRLTEIMPSDSELAGKSVPPELEVFLTVPQQRIWNEEFQEELRQLINLIH